MQEVFIYLPLKYKFFVLAQYNSLSIKNSNFIKGIGILMIAFHNFFHHISPMPGENEFDLNLVRIQNFWTYLLENPANFIDLLFSFFGHYGVQLFILISGYGLMRAYGNKSISWKPFMKKRLNKLYPTFVFAAIILAISMKLYHGWTISLFEYYIKLTLVSNFLPGKIFSLNGPWWFYGMIVQLYIVFPWLTTIYRKYQSKGLIGIAAIAYLIMLLFGDYFIGIDEHLHYHFLGNLPVFIAGMLMASKEKFEIKPYYYILALGVFILGNIYSSAFFFSHLSIAILLFGGSIFLSEKLSTNKGLGKQILFYGEISMYLFAVHGFLRGPFIDLANLNENPDWRPLTTFLTAILFLGFSTLVALGLRWVVKKYLFGLQKLEPLLETKLKNKVFERFFSFLNQFYIQILSMIVLVFLMRIFEYYLLISNYAYLDYTLTQAAFSGIRDGLLMAAVYGIIGTFIFPFSFLSKKVTLAFSFILSIIFIIVHYSAILYFYSSLTPLDHVVLAFSISGLWEIANSSSDLPLWYYSLFFIFPLIFVGLIILFKNIRLSKLRLLALFILIIFLGTKHKKFFANQMSYQTETAYNCNKNKGMYFIKQIVDHINLIQDKPEQNVQQIIRSYQKLHTEKQFISINYPYLHSKENKDVLGPFFNKIDSEKAPNVVVIIIESLSNAVSGFHTPYISFTPFLDSLAQSSLYWPNTLSTSERTFNVLPAILGSLPYGENTVLLDQDQKMPYFTDMVSTLNKNKYQSRFFYGGWIGFTHMDQYFAKDGMQDMIHDFPNYKRIPENEKGFSWGFDDEAIFMGSFPHLDSTNPYLSVYLSLTTHSPFLINNQDFWLDVARQDIETKAKKEDQEKLKSLVNRFAPFRYMDAMLQEYFENYKKRSDYENTIFIITGDHHSYSIPPKMPLDAYHVPLLIYSPTLKSPKKFQNPVSHMDVAPSILNYLENNYDLKMNNKAIYSGNVLDTSAHFNPKLNQSFVRNSRAVDQRIEGQYFLSQEKLYKIDNKLDISEIKNDSIKNQIQRNLENESKTAHFAIVYNRVMPSSIYNKEIGFIKLKTIQANFDKDLLGYYSESVSKEQFYSKPNSIFNGTDEYSAFAPKFTFNSGFRKLRISAQFQLLVEKFGSKAPLLVISISDKNGKSIYWEALSIKEDFHTKLNSWSKIEFKHEINLSDLSHDGNQLKLYFWNQDTHAKYYMDDLKLDIHGIPKE